MDPASAASALLLLTSDGRYLLQHRDDIPEIWFPGLWGCFGGALDPGEDLKTTAQRELEEELGIVVKRDELQYFTEFTFDFSQVGSDNKYRAYFVHTLKPGTEDTLALREGQAVAAFSEEQALSTLPMTPYDRCALHLHSVRYAIVPPDQRRSPITV